MLGEPLLSAVIVGSAVESPVGAEVAARRPSDWLPQVRRLVRALGPSRLLRGDPGPIEVAVEKAGHQSIRRQRQRRRGAEPHPVLSPPRMIGGEDRGMRGDLGMRDRCHTLSLVGQSRQHPGEQWHHERFIVTDRRVLLVYGLLTQRIGVMPLSKVTDLTYERSLAGRLLGYGAFVVESAGQHQAFSRIDFLPYPDRLYHDVSMLLFRDRSASRRPHEHPTAPLPNERWQWP